MRETLQAMSTRGLLEIVGLILVAAALIYVVLRWSRRSGARPAAMVAARAGSQIPHATEEITYVRAPSRSAASEDTKELVGISPTALGRLRSGREEDRPSEDDVVRQHLGPRGVPGEPAPANTLPENETQMPKPLDPGHTA